MPNEQIRDFVILGIDIDSYSVKPIRDQNAAQKKIDQFFAEALDGTRHGKPEPRWLDTGDGGYMLLEWSAADALQVVERFCELLNDHNGEVIATRRIEVRIALHYGKVICWEGKLGSKYTSDIINACCRMVDGMPRNRGGQVVCSESFREHINVLGEHATAIRLRDVKDKHGSFHPVYNLCRKPGFGVEPHEREMHENPMARIIS